MEAMLIFYAFFGIVTMLAIALFVYGLMRACRGRWSYSRPVPVQSWNATSYNQPGHAVYQDRNNYIAPPAYNPMMQQAPPTIGFTAHVVNSPDCPPKRPDDGWKGNAYDNY